MSLGDISASEVLDTFPPHLRSYPWQTLKIIIACTAIWTLLRWHYTSRRRVRATPLRGPPSESFLYGVGKRVVFGVEDSGATYEAWAKEYGPVYAIPSTLGNTRVILCDPKAIAHFCAKETRTYVLTPMMKKLRADFPGKGLQWAEGEDHKRQRKSLTPAFSVSAIRQVTPIFYDSAYKAKAAWDAIIQSSNGSEDWAVIEVQNWMNHISLDTIGLAGFSHNFGALEGKHSPVTEIFDTFSASRQSNLNTGLLLLSEFFPFLIRVPTARNKLVKKLGATIEDISEELLARTRREMEMGMAEGKGENSIMGLLIKGAGDQSVYQLTSEEVMAQMKVLLLAGYETTAISMTWTLLELSRNPDVQTKLRNELLSYDADPTYDQLTNDLPYLDAVVHEILRIHSPATELTRVAAEDDVIPLSESFHTKSDELVNSVTVAKGTLISVPIQCINQSVAIWGEDAKVFRPSRWLGTGTGQNSIPAKAKEIQGHRHLLTFSDGPRTCLGKNFALTEFKAVLTVLVKNFVFELRDGVNSKIEIGWGVLPRPKLAGEVGCRLPLRVRPYVASEWTEGARASGVESG